MANGSFGTAINCIDGRTQRPVADWLMTYGQAQYVDMVTEPGADGLFVQGPGERLEQIRRAVELSINAHHSTIVAIAGHYDCAAYGVSPEEHKQSIRQAATLLADWGTPVRVVGLWVNDQWQVEVISDSHAR